MQYILSSLRCTCAPYVPTFIYAMHCTFRAFMHTQAIRFLCYTNLDPSRNDDCVARVAFVPAGGLYCFKAIYPFLVLGCNLILSEAIIETMFMYSWMRRHRHKDI